MKYCFQFAVALSFLAFSQFSSAQFFSKDPMKLDPAAQLVKRSLVHNLFPWHEADEAYEARMAGHLPPSTYDALMDGATEDYFHDMDYGITNPVNQDALKARLSAFIPGITKEEAVRRAARGRNNWIVWTGGNDRFWNYMTTATFGNLDFLKTISSHPSMAYGRHNRWETLGLVNEPCFKEPKGPSQDRFGLWLDERTKDCGPDPFENEVKYPGIKVGSRGTTITYMNGDKRVEKKFEAGSFYGYGTGIIGLRLFPNPDFDSKAAAAWDPKKYYEDPDYYNDPKLIRPYRVGMSCAFCHVGPSPTRPPADFNNPKWENLNSNPGAQYFWVDRIFVWNYTKKQDNFIFQLIHTSRPGSLDTSLISSDQMNNPRTMNAVYDIPSRVEAAMKFGHNETLTGPEQLNNQFTRLDNNLVPSNSVLRATSSERDRVLSLRVLKDGSDSVGVLGALNRVYINIGLFGEEWIQNFIPVIGGSHITPFRISEAERRSVFWNATVSQTPDLALFFLAANVKDKLQDAPDGKTYLKEIDSEVVNTGKKVFADNCAACHSSKLPERAYTFFNRENPNECVGANYLKCWKEYWAYVKTPEFKSEMEAIVRKNDFLDRNYLSTDLRIPVNLVDSVLCSPIATNAIEGNIWDNFSSTSYKQMKSVGRFTVNYPMKDGITMKSGTVEVPGGGRGFLRPPSLISLWSTAPFLQNNSLGKYDDRGSVKGRMESFDDSIKRLLNPELRGENPRQGEQAVNYVNSFGKTVPGVMDVTTEDSYLKIPKGYFPKALYKILTTAAEKSKATDFMVAGTAYPDYKADAIARGYKAPTKFTDSKKDKKRNVAAYQNGNGYPEEDSADYSAAEMGEVFQLGPIPKGVPINLISNIDLKGNDKPIIGNKVHLAKIEIALYKVYKAIEKVKKMKATNKFVGLTKEQELIATKQYRDAFMEIASESLLEVSKCNDFVVNRGHYFGTKYGPNPEAALSDSDKTALVEYLKHF